MSGPFEQLAGLNKLIHEPARLAICTALASCERADFLYLLRLTELSKGNLSAHLAKLEAGGIITIEKSFKGRIPRTQIALTDIGRTSVETYWERLEQARAASIRFQHPTDVEPEHGTDTT